MNIRHISLALVATVAAVAPAFAATAPTVNALTTQTLNKYFDFAGLRYRVDKIETVSTADARPIYVKAVGNSNPGKGYILVTMSIQNPSDTDDTDVTSNWLGFELGDGSQIDEGSPTGMYLASSLNDPPGSLHPKQHIQIVYIVTDWNGQPLTKMFMRNNGGTELNEPGYHHVRFMVPKGYVSELAPKT